MSRAWPISVLTDRFARAAQVGFDPGERADHGRKRRVRD
ncbi:hypothetical protein MBEHAL_0388 [Halarchaeum acidiphilum MH1-52-1]|uniref:Uncharacterized protein n=1 Tax=Halarchaeum acidiphilum MH1-52-1 TaxID=1261545 RepID=U3AA37_9EURY|nr:hypothetical protein MBEHAL_0388 [Halarchaeum acidiphilum MH1-52-1]